LAVGGQIRRSFWPSTVNGQPSTFLWLALGELRSATCLAEADFLALDFACITRDVAGIPQRLAQRLVVFHESSRQAVANRTGLTGDPAAVHGDGHVELRLHAHELERLTNDHARGL